MNLNKKIVRYAENTTIAGVCGAIADFLEVSPKIVRIAYLVFTVLTAIFPGVDQRPNALIRESFPAT